MSGNAGRMGLTAARRGSGPSRWRTLDWFGWGSIAVVTAAILQCVAHSARSGLFSSADESAHLDYAYQVWHGALPVFEQGLVLEPGFGWVPPVQWTAQHPPLFYALLAPVVGPLVDAGHVVAAGYAARGLNSILAGAVVAAIVWATRQVLTSRRHWALTAGIVAAVNGWLVRVGGAVYNDTLSTLFATLLIGLTARAVRRGLTWRTTAALAAVAAGGLLARASVAAVLVVCLAVLVLAAPPRAERGGSVVPSMVTIWRVALVGLAPVIASGWFYWRNLRMTGRLIGGNPEWGRVTMGRTSRPVLDVVTDPASLERLYSLFSYGQVPLGPATVVLLCAPAVLGLVAVGRLWRIADAPGRREGAAVGLLLAGATGLVVLQQALYVAGGGGLHPRYLLPVLLPVCVLMALGLLLPERPRGGLVVAWVLLAQVDWLAFLLGGIGLPSPLPAFPVMALVLAAFGLVALGAACMALVLGCRSQGLELPDPAMEPPGGLSRSFRADQRFPC